MTISHDPDARLDYAWDWSGWLADGETITTATLESTGGVSTTDPVISGGTVTTWISGGSERYARITMHITTSQDREDDRTLTLSVADR